MNEEILKNLIEFLQKASPMIWDTFMRQVYADAFSYIAWSLVFFSAMFGLLKFSGYAEKQQVEDMYSSGEWEATTFWSRIVAFIMFLFSFGFFVSACMRFYNPSYYAIQLIVAQIK